MESLDVTAPDGRRLEVLHTPSGDLPLVVHHGTPGAAVPYGPFEQAAAAAGLRLVLYSRPGYAGSTPAPGRSVASCAADVAAVLDALGADRFVTAGLSGGGPHALACAALLPQRCLAAASVAGVAPWDAEGLDFLAGQGEENVQEWTLAGQGADPLEAWLTEAAAGLGTVTGEQLAASLGSLAPPVDAAALVGDFGENVAANFRSGLAPGVAGWRDDDLAFVAAWGFDVAGISRPVAVWQGSADTMVPLAHGRWLAARVRGARVHLLDGEGHLSLLANRMADVMAELVDLAAQHP